MLLIIASIENLTDRALMEDFYEKHVNLLFYEAKKHLPVQEDAEDAVYEAFRRLIEKMDVFRNLKAPARARYAVVTVRNICYMQLRKKQKQPLISFEELAEDIPIPVGEQPEERVGNAQAIRSVLAALDREDRMILEQKYILHWTDGEMAALFDIKPDSMRTKITRARHNLLEEMNAQGFKFDLPIKW